MNKKLMARLFVDLAMTVLLLCAFAYRITGDTAHEWIGVSVFLLFIIHNGMNWNWYKNIFRGNYTFKRIVMTVVNIPLAFSMITVIITGLLQSRTVLAFLRLPGDMLLRQVHTTAAYWGLLLISVHVGIHWQMFINGARKMAGIKNENRLRKIIVRVFVFLITAFGVAASFDRDMFAKLFQGFSFDYWDENRPAILFFAAMLSIMAVYVCITYYVLKVIDRKKIRVDQKKRENLPKVDEVRIDLKSGRITLRVVDDKKNE